MTMTETSKPTEVAMTARNLLKQLQAEFPVIRDAQALAIGIDKQVIAVLPEVNRKLLRGALGIHTKSLRYLKSLQTAQVRYNLDGSPAGETSAEQRELAAQTLRDHFKKQATERRDKMAEQARVEAEERAERERSEKLQKLAEKFSRH